MKYVIEHLEPELFKWCVIEYKHISKIVGRENLIITNIKEKEKLKDYAEMHSENVGELGFKDVCILDPGANKTLEPSDAKKFKYIVLGGILGDNPPRKRTKEELTLEGERRNLGKKQMATDNAVYVAKEILNGKRFEDLKFIDGIEVETAEGESCILQFSYVVVDDKPLISDELVEYLKKEETF